MTPEKWQSIVGNVKDKFEVLEYDKEHLDEEGGIDIEYIIFNGPMGKMRLEFIAKPVVLDKKTTYSNRIGSETKIDYIYSDAEKSHQLLTYKWDETANDWVEIDSANFGN
ncbi:MAG: hypothetical protein PHT51_02130 [Patescibacteria group bacterium]|nr:hypothetical protein [Patescibacteria group bacterium]MDD4611027.1 hypothetical protein [Patescibacteria group bacterium]